MSNRLLKKSNAELHNYNRWLRNNTVGQRVMRKKQPRRQVITTAMLLGQLRDINLGGGWYG